MFCEIGHAKFHEPFHFGDNIFSVSASIVCHIGKVGWKKVVDASPYITQNKWLTEYVNSVLERNHTLNRLHKKDAATIAELRKILEIEGLLNLYGNRLAELYSDDSYKSYPRNDYSDLNSLKARLAHKDWDGKGVITSKPSENSSSQGSSNCLKLDFLNGQKCIGAPIHFFFKLGTSDLTDMAQIVNVDELARVAKEFRQSLGICVYYAKLANQSACQVPLLLFLGFFLGSLPQIRD